MRGTETAGTKLEESNQVYFTRSELVKLRFRALRQGVWFRVLNRVERGMVNLAVKIVKKVRSLVLARSMALVAKKLLTAMESDVAHLMRTVGFTLAQKLSRIAQSWGNRSAVRWAVDLGFVKFLAICHMDTFGTFNG